MKTILKQCLLVSMLLISFSCVSAQTLPDSTMKKIYGFRAFYESLGKAYPADSTVNVTETAIGGVKSYWFNKGLTNQKQLIIYLHGGAYVYGNINAYTAMLSHLSKSLVLLILYVEYSLAPEHPFPSANQEILKVYRELQKQFPGYRITVIGDSAGGGLAIALVHDAQKENLPLPANLALISPWVDLKGNNQSYKTKQAVDPVLTKTFLLDHARYYAGSSLKEADPSELRFKKFPPVLLMVGTDEILNDDAKHFYAYIKPIQPATKFKEFDGQKHVWLFTNINAPAAVEAVSDIKTFIR